MAEKMDKCEQRCWSIRVVGYGLSADECWKDFQASLDDWLFWTTGNKYWRVAPHYNEWKDIAKDATEHIVAARITLLNWKHDGLIEVAPKPPWPTEEEVAKAYDTMTFEKEDPQ